MGAARQPGPPRAAWRRMSSASSPCPAWMQSRAAAAVSPPAPKRPRLSHFGVRANSKTAKQQQEQGQSRGADFCCFSIRLQHRCISTDTNRTTQQAAGRGQATTAQTPFVRGRPSTTGHESTDEGHICRRYKQGCVSHLCLFCSLLQSPIGPGSKQSFKPACKATQAMTH